MPEFVSSSKALKVEARLVDLSTAADDNTPACKDDNNDTSDTEVNPTIPQPINEENGLDMLNIPPPPLPPNNAGNQGTPVETASALTLSRWLQNKAKRKTEILLALKYVLCRYSFKSNDDTSALFAHMFCDSYITKNYSLNRTKLGYLITFGLAPYFEETLQKSVKQSSCFKVVFDESFNDLLQLDQMDVLVIFWKADKVMTRYLGRQFLDSGKAEDSLEAIKKSLAGLDPSKLVQLGIDGPYVNLKLQIIYAEERKRADVGMPDHLDVGSCSLHIVNGAIGTGM